MYQIAAILVKEWQELFLQQIRIHYGYHRLDATVEAIITNPGTSDWLKHTLQSALSRDCMDAARDAETLAEILGQRANAQLATLASGGQT